MNINPFNSKSKQNSKTESLMESTDDKGTASFSLGFIRQKRVEPVTRDLKIRKRDKGT
jgi:hypothetical protein